MMSNCLQIVSNLVFTAFKGAREESYLMLESPALSLERGAHSWLIRRPFQVHI